MRKARIERVLNIMDDKELDACALRGMDNIFYLTGFRGSEGTLIVTRGDVLLLTDFRYMSHAKEVTTAVKIVELKGKQNVFLDVCKQYGIKRIGFDSPQTTYQIFKRWNDTIPETEFIPLEIELEEIRKCKESDEIDAIRKAVDIATCAFVEVFEKIRPGITEKEIADDLEYAMRRLGAESPSFDTIVASGARAALPHAVPTNKEIKEGEAIIIDFGARVNGYCSDETCTVATGEVNGKIKDIFKVVNGARELGLKKAKVGIPIKELDVIVRGFIDESGYGEYFRHGVGHGIGVAVHEAPGINSSGDGILEENMVITIEPGIYLPNIGGVRLEDMVLIQGDEAKLLTRLRKDMLSISV